MSAPILLPAFTIGEVSPSLFGRFDQARLHVAAATARNVFVSYRGGAYSRAGTMFVGFSKQTGRNYSPRLISFQFSINQGLALEFGNFYMRVVSNGAFVTESPFAITGISQTNPAVVNYLALSTAVSVVANNGAISSSYARGDTITLAGGVAVTPVQMLVNSTTLAKLNVLLGGSNYAAGDIVTLAGGSSTLAPVLTVLTVNGSGAILTFSISNGGSFTANGSGNFTQASTSGLGTGATFSGGLFGPLVITFSNVGAYTTVPANPVNQGGTSGVGAGATYTMVWATPLPLANGDWVFVNNVVGMAQVNDETYVITNLTASSFTLQDVYGNNIDATGFSAYVSGGTASRIYTLTTPYSEVDLAYLKFTQSADVMSLCCVNQMTGTEYPPLDLSRLADDNWVLAQVIPAPTISPPAGSVTVTGSTTGAADYQYVVTSVDPNNGTESVASAIGAATGQVNVAATAGTITITWNAVLTANKYNIYKATPGLSAVPPAGALFGYAGSAYGTQFIDPNIVADFTQVPPTNQNPFARGQIIGATVTGGGSGSSFAITINTLTGSGAVIVPVIVSSVLVALIVQEPGENYQPSDTLSITNGATGTLQIGRESGTYPSVVAYFQERRFYANTSNNPDTYFGSQPGAFTNFDKRDPTIDSDSITGSPWAVEVNGIQFMVPMPTGLMVLTGLSAWLLNGGGGGISSGAPITPASQSAQPQAYNGCSQTVPPIKIDYDVLYLQAKGSIYRRFNFDISANIYTGEDITINSSHLFTGYTIKEHAWCEEPYKVMWAVRDDGALLSATINKPQQVLGWTRHDTDGTFQSTCSVTEPPVDALYLATQRFPGANTAYMIERMNNRIWSTVEDAWCVDCGAALAQPQPNATLSASSATGLGSITGATGLIGGTGYSASTTASVVDQNGQGPGTGAVPTLTIVGGVITAVAFAPGNQGSGYVSPKLVIVDPTNSGSGADAILTLNNTATFSANAAVFSAPNVGSVIRMGGGIATITAITDSQHVVANITQPIVQVRQRTNGSQVPLPQASGNWSMTSPVTTINDLQYLAGAFVTGVADGVEIPIMQVPASGIITLPQASTSVVVGLGFTPQVQSVYLDGGEPTMQGQRKKIAAVTLRVEASRGLEVGTNQIDGSTLSPAQIGPPWPTGPGGMTVVEDKGAPPFGSTLLPLYTGDIRIPTSGGFGVHGQVAVQQRKPFPMNLLALIPEDWPGDTPQLKSPNKREAKQPA